MIRNLNSIPDRSRAVECYLISLCALLILGLFCLYLTHFQVPFKTDVPCYIINNTLCQQTHEPSKANQLLITFRNRGHDYQNWIFQNQTECETFCCDQEFANREKVSCQLWYADSSLAPPIVIFVQNYIIRRAHQAFFILGLICLATSLLMMIILTIRFFLVPSPNGFG